MIATKINLKNCVCHKCHKAFQNNSEIIHPVRELNHHYCFDCEGNAFINSVRENNSAKYVLYYVENGIGKLNVDCDSFDMLPAGIYELKLNEVRKNCSFIVWSVWDKKENLPDFLRRSDFKNYILEKQDFGSCLFFPEHKILNTYDFYDNRSSYTSVSRIFQTWIKKDEYGYAFTPYKIIGITSKSMCHHESQICNARRMYAFDIKTLDDIEKLYARNVPCRYMSSILETLTPAVMLDYCQKRIQGQGLQLKKAVYKIYNYMQTVAAGVPFHAENWLLTSPSGTGKTEFYRTIRDLFRQYNIPIPVVQIDLSHITETGYKGANVSTIPERILSEKKDSAGIGICFLDEADKKCIPSYGNHNVDNNAAVQSNLLTLLEGTEMRIDINDKEHTFDSGKTMFVLLGSFQKLRDEKQKAEMDTRRIGFQPEHDACTAADNAFHEDLSIQDIIDFGMQEELAGRLSSVVNFRRLSEKDMLTLIRCKANEIAHEMDCKIVLNKSAEKAFLKASFGNLGIRQPINLLRTLIQDAIAEVFFDSGFNKSTDRIIIDSPSSARIESLRADCRQGYE